MRRLTIKRIIERELVPGWRTRPVTSITRAEAIVLLEGIVDRGHATTAHLVLAYGRKLYRWALMRGIYGLDQSPFEGISARDVIGPKGKRSRVLSDDELRLFWRATAELDSGQSDEVPLGTFARLLLLTGQRLREVAHATRREFDFGEVLWLIGCDRMKNNATNEVPIGPLALDFFRPLADGDGDAFVFSTTGGERPISGFDKLKNRLIASMVNINRRDLGVSEDDVALRKALGLKTAEPIPPQYCVKPFVFHDLRRTMRSRLSALPIAHEVRELMISHKKTGLDRVYDHHEFRDEKRRGFALWEQRVLAITTPPPANVVQMRAAIS